MSWAEVELLKREIDAVDDKVQSLTNRTYGVVPPLTTNTATNPTTTYATASANAVAGETLDFTFTGAKIIHAIVFVPGASSYGSGMDYGTFDKVILTIDGTVIELTLDTTTGSIGTNGYKDNWLCWVGQATYRAKLVNGWSSSSVHSAVMPVQVKCNSNITISLNCTDAGEQKLRCKIFYSK